MTPRIPDHFAKAPKAVQAMMTVEAALRGSGLDTGLVELIRLRASQINGCAFCIHMHVTEALKHGETAMRLHMLPAWRDSTLYTARERAALGWTEALTLVAQTGAPDADYAALAAEFSEEECVVLTMLIGTINFWNRVQVGLRAAHPVEASPDAAAAR